ncbi:MAG: hypothetical protein AB1578_15200 [Thermodesulfobacteriota bacterium]|jgi:NAD-dependent DNA ligase
MDLEKNPDTNLTPLGELSLEPKFDGLSVGVVYGQGRFRRGLRDEARKRGVELLGDYRFRELLGS